MEPEIINDLENYNIYQNYTSQLTSQGTTGIQSPLSLNPYSSWCLENGCKISYEEIKVIVDELVEKFGFQADNGANMLDHLMGLLDSRSSRMSCSLALISLHSDYIGGDASNYKKWYFMAHFELDEDIISHNVWKSYNQYHQFVNRLKYPIKLFDNVPDKPTYLLLEFRWRQYMSKLTDSDLIQQLALYLLIWGEANNVRFMPECIDFIFKCSLDCLEDSNSSPMVFLDDVITPLYNYIISQQFYQGSLIRNKKDHNHIIGYDDINQFFWLPENLLKIKLGDDSLLLTYPKEKRITKFKSIDWNKAFYKTYKEKRSWMHLVTNFSRIWIIHISMFWYYTSFNSPFLYTKNYIQLLDNQPAPQVQWTVVSGASILAIMIAIFAAISEYSFIPRNWPGALPVKGRLFSLLLLLIINTAPTVYILGFIPLDSYSKHANIIGIGQFVVSVITVLYLAIKPPSCYFNLWLKPNANVLKTQIFTANFPKLKLRSQLESIILWIVVFMLKFSESYFFLTLSLRDPIRVLYAMDLSRCKGDVIFGTWLCYYQAKSILVLLYFTDLVLFFLDTYLWYIICNCFFSIGLSFYLGISVFTPWRNIFARLPERIATKLVYSLNESNSNLMPVIALIWNAIVLSLYREHLLSLEQVSKLVYQFLDESEFGPTVIKTPTFFVSQDDNSGGVLKDYFTPGEDSERRISFFAQSLSSPLPETIPTSAMPLFTVLIPHYSEKIILNLKEVIKEDKESKVSVLDYLKKLKKNDWECFVQDTKILTAISAQTSGDDEDDNSVKLNALVGPYDDLPLYSIGFKNQLSESTLRTRIWASLRSQTLYRTISGFMNYEKAIKLLYQVENSDPNDQKGGNYSELALNHFVSRKFNLLVSMQRLQKFNDDEWENARILFEAFPTVKVAYLEEEKHPTTNEVVYYSTLLDTSQVDDKGEYQKKYRIKLSGNPILGDGKSDNQNHAIIFYRGEYIQVIDANQDNYLEECLKIKSVLSEFEEYHLDIPSEYTPGLIKKPTSPVAIIGTREYIFSENIGILGDIAAAKEETFGTLFARTLAEIGAKLHYGHPDFLNGIFMTTRGGISKAQKGLHLNEDIYAGMMVTCRGGRIKHCDYYQCGKGRDLGFGTILNFTIKIGAGMGEQILSREHYYLGVQLPIDRFLSFYYAHAGFHINNLFILLSMLLFMMVLLNLGALNNQIILCDYNPHKPITDIEEPLGCYNLQPVLNWVSRFVISVFICFFISFLPLIFQELIGKGIVKAGLRIMYHLLSMAPVFEVFVAQVYAAALSGNISFGGAKYIATGRGFAISRISYPLLYSRYASYAIYSGAKLSLIIIFATITMWQPSIMWFWLTVISLCLAPVLFNPHQFTWSQFFYDYREYILWLTRGKSRWHRNSWYGYQKLNRAKILGYKKRRLNEHVIKTPSKRHLIGGQLVMGIFPLMSSFLAYMFINAQTGVDQDYKPVNPLLRIGIITGAPIVIDGVILAASFCISVTLGPLLNICCQGNFGTLVAAINHGLAIFITILDFEILFYLEGWSIAKTICGVILVIELQDYIKNIVYVFILARELGEDTSNNSWWTGKWFSTKLGLLVITQPFREFIVKIIELNLFAYDFILGHCILFIISPLLLVPFIDKWHTSMLLWLKPSTKFRATIISKRAKKRLTRISIRYALLFLCIMITFVGLVLVPLLAADLVPDITGQFPTIIAQLMQPMAQDNNDTDTKAPPSVLREKPQQKPMETVF